MVTTRVGRLTAALVILGIARLAGAAGSPRRETPLKSGRASFPAPEPAPKPFQGPTFAEPATARSETTERLRRLTGASEKDAKATGAGSKALQEVLQDRLKWLDDWDKAVKARYEAEHPEPSPERQTADLTADLERVKAALDQSAKAPESLLPASFRSRPAVVSEALRGEMKEAIESAQGELKEWAAKLEKGRGDPGQTTTGPLAAIRAERDKIHQRVVTLKTRRTERESALATAKTAEARELARERLINFEWESRVEQELLQGHEARMALEAKLADLATLKAQVCEAHVQAVKKTLASMQTRYKAVAELEERALQQAAVSEQDRASRTDDPLERYRARRKAELLEFQAQLIKDEKALDANTPPSLDEQKALADAAEYDFASVKRLLDDGKVSHLDALRLNNDFRRIGPERERIVKTELARASNQLIYYENALSGVELALVNGSRDDRFEFDSLMERLSEARHAEASAVFDELETKHEGLLKKRRKILEKLAARAEQTHEQVTRRVRILDDQYGFIRTHIFWVRDQEPIGDEVVKKGRRESTLLGRGLVRLALDAGDPALRGKVSVEFILGAVAAMSLPWLLVHARRRIGPGRLDARRSPAVAPE